MPVEVASRVDVAWQDELWVGRTVGASTTWTQILGVETVGMPEQTPEEIDVTHMQSPGRTRETLPGFLPAVDYSQDLQDWGSSEAFLQLLDDLAALTEAGTPEFVQIEMVVGARRRAYRGYVNTFTPEGAVGDKRTAAVTFKIFNRVTTTRVPGGAAAPVNTVPPYIIGTPTVGETLTAWDGVWDSTWALSYQWKADSSTIPGATGKTLVLASAQASKVITVEVTATNNAGSTPVESAATAAVSS